MDNEKNFLPKIKEFEEFRMPRWNDLPEIDLYMDQVISVTDKYLGILSTSPDPVLTPSMINNYVKNRIIPPPTKKKYNREHLAKLIIICIMKPVMEISAISDVLSRNEALFGIEKMLDEFAAMFEKSLANLSRAALLAFESTDKTEEMLCTIAIESAVKSGTEKIIAEYAYSAACKGLEKEEENKAQEPKKEVEKNSEKEKEKEKEKTKEKTKAKSKKEPAEMSET